MLERFQSDEGAGRGAGPGGNPAAASADWLRRLMRGKEGGGAWLQLEERKRDIKIVEPLQLIPRKTPLYAILCLIFLIFKAVLFISTLIDEHPPAEKTKGENSVWNKGGVNECKPISSGCFAAVCSKICWDAAEVFNQIYDNFFPLGALD